MKRATKLVLVTRVGAEHSRKQTGRHRARSGKKASPPEGFYVDFGGINLGQAPPIDAMIMPALNAALAPISEEFPEACVQRRLLPDVVLNHLVRARFLSFFLLPARAAQEETGVRASILLSDAVHTRGDWADNSIGESNDIFKTGQCFANIYEAFLERALWLKNNRRFRAVMQAMADPAECLKQLGSCKLWDEMRSRDRVATIVYDCLQECDTLKRSPV